MTALPLREIVMGALALTGILKQTIMLFLTRPLHLARLQITIINMTSDGMTYDRRCLMLANENNMVLMLVTMLMLVEA
jgi:hypothetical protein